MVLALVLAPMLGVAIAVQYALATPSELVVRPIPVWIDRNEVTTTGSVQAVLDVHLAPAQELVSTGGSGVVTRLVAKPGSTVRDGEPLLEVDGIVKTGVHTSRPFYRTMAEGDRGADVTEFNAFLARRGLLSERAQDRYGAATVAAAKSFARSVGIMKPDGGFDPSWLIYLPAKAIVLGQWSLRLGAVYPERGSPIATEEPRATTASIVDHDGNPVQVTDSSYLITVAGHDAGIAEDPKAVPPGVVAKVMELAGSSSVDSVSSDQSQSKDIKIDVVARWPKPRTALEVPTSAVMTDAAGDKQCMWTRKSAGDSLSESVAVEVVGGSLGVTHVNGSIPDGAQVLANPADVMAKPTCP